MSVLARLFAIAAFVFASACGVQQGQDFAMPIDDVYERLEALDLGKEIDSATYMFDKHTTTSGKENESVTWRLKGKDIMIAHLTARDANMTNVRIELPSMTAEGKIMMRGLGEKIMAERIAAHLERRPFNDQKIMDGLYAGSMVPKGIQSQAIEAQREYARTRRALNDLDERGHSPSPAKTYVSTRSASAPTTDLSGY